MGSRKRAADLAGWLLIGWRWSGGCGRSIGPRFRLPSVDRRHPSFLGLGGGLLPRLRACRKGQLSGAYEEGIAGMFTIIKASLLGSALMLLASCTGYLTNYQTPCVEGTSANV